MARKLDLDTLLHGCADTSFDAGIRIDVELEPLAGDGGPVKPATYAGGTYQRDRRWATPTAAEPTDVIVIDNVPSQANRLEEALRRHRAAVAIPELVLDLSDLAHLPAHLPRQLSSLQFPHRNGDAYLRDATLDGKDFMKEESGKSIFAATPENCGALVAWFPQALLYGFWQSHLGNKRAQTKHARAWVSEIIGWKPASTEIRTFGVKGDPLNLSIEEEVKLDTEDDQTKWEMVTSEKAPGNRNTKEKKKKLSKIGHGQVPFTDKDAALGPVSFSRITQRATLSFAQLRRLHLGQGASDDANTAMRALLVAMGLHAHQLAFGHGFALRSGAALRPRRTVLTWLGADADEECAPSNANDTQALLESARSHAESAGVPLDGWGQVPTILLPKDNLKKAIASTWPELAD
ncbi:MAG: type I-U CRISPR-associated protein Cas7 [Synechococcus sp. SB0676_bin_10]|uniref:Type I-U CRISPR-associated protein Cas7 n=1 Tax=Synechococcus sp. SB0676_bin_10 TaxID=2604869 RepID=A0A6B1F838_9SYNE|nr:type I-U CRISPR-associated protein Cas7 [Synechococcus sp. SB0664_bin_36]MYG37925.1 type I-U CRISPR-associated protein Cas7 [Synechococcus sp. SB0676_bin_10]MYG64898.1 type I-U CRISPR-associated protein Cas7 [Synechococcus sp. SB0675_bin_7]MYK85386.1 type I-U CRISPR-associated protein Cas7 [Synechococcus sp. SB0669_bin_7]